MSALPKRVEMTMIYTHVLNKDPRPSAAPSIANPLPTTPPSTPTPDPRPGQKHNPNNQPVQTIQLAMYLFTGQPAVPGIVETIEDMPPV